jgi:anti-sigma factor RsiW
MIATMHVSIATIGCRLRGRIDEARALASERLAWCAARRQREREAEQRATAPPLANPPPAEVLPSAPPQQEPGKRAGIEALRAAHLARLAAA